MKKLICLILVVLLLCGCQANESETTAPAETTEAPVETPLPQEMTVPVITVPGGVFGTPEGDALAFENPGKVRIAYTGQNSYVKYVTCVEELPDEEALKGYDAAFFEEHALVIVVETASSGSVQLEIGGIYRAGDTATVTLKRTMSGDFGTADMATWLLWAEVSREWDYNWVLDNDSQLPQGEKY